jgi:serine/threonine-protein kinase
MLALHRNPERRWLGRYELVGEIACGQLATVFLARLAGVGGFQRLYAIKRLHHHWAGDPELVRIFLDEARLAAKIHHPSVVPIVECGEGDDTYFVVMPYIEGDNVAAIVDLLGGYAPDSKQSPLPVPVTLRIVLDALSGLQAAHDLVDATGTPMGLVHRDCSPRNIIVSTEGCARIIDFGGAANERNGPVNSPQSPDRRAYLSPEQLRGEGADRRADVYAMGIVLWELLAGRRLLRGAIARDEAAGANALANVGTCVPPLRAVAPTLPDALERVCTRALQADPANRYESASDMATDIEAERREAIASPHEVARFVSEVLGDRLAARRSALRAWRSGAITTPALEPCAEASAHEHVGAAPGTNRPTDGSATPAETTPGERWSMAPLEVARARPGRGELRGAHIALALLALVAIGSATALAMRRDLRGSATESATQKGQDEKPARVPLDRSAAEATASAEATPVETAVRPPDPRTTELGGGRPTTPTKRAGGAPATSLAPSTAANPRPASSASELMNPYR